MTVPPAKMRRPRQKNAKARVEPYAPNEAYRVGPGRPPRKFQFKPGQSGNPKGAKRKPPSIAPDLKAILEQALNKKVTLRQGEKERIISMAAAGIQQLVAQFAKGDRYARRDLIDLAHKLGVELTAGQDQVVENALETTITAEDAALVDAFLKRQHDHDGGQLDQSSPQSDQAEPPNRNEEG